MASVDTKALPIYVLSGGDYSLFPGVSQYPGRHWLKWGMKRFYGANYTHAWVAFKLGGIPLIYHSTAFGVHVRGWESFQADRHVKHMWEVPLPEDMFFQFVVEAFTETGKKYSNRQLFGAAIAKLFRLKRLPFGVNREKEHVCSETAGRMIVKYTAAEWEGKDPDLYTPKDFFDTCEALETRGDAIRLVKVA